MLMESQASSSQVLNGADSVDVLPQGIWNPNVDDDLKPSIDMAFKSIEEAGIFYEEYGRAGGFETRSSSTKYSATRELIGKSFVCSKEGATQSKSTGIRRTGSIRTNCKAIMRLVLDRQTRLWVVTKFVEEHNHEVITPSRLHLLKANREVSKAKKTLLKQFKQSNIATCKAVSYLENINGGFNRIGCTEKDLRNWERDVKYSLKGHDAQMLIDHFKWQHEQDSRFFYDFDTTDEAKSLSSKDDDYANEQLEDENEKNKEFSLVEVYEPDHAKTKGRNKGKRMIPGRENIKGRNRVCNGCKRRGQNHDIRNCLFLKQEDSKVHKSSDLVDAECTSNEVEEDNISK